MSSRPIVEVSTEFSFDAAHHFQIFPEGHPNRRLHGHSFRARITIGGTPDPKTGFVREFSELEAIADGIRDRLDHRLLNEIEGIASPSLETLAVWIWGQAKPTLPEIRSVTVFRDSCRQSCTYSGAVQE